MNTRWLFILSFRVPCLPQKILPLQNICTILQTGRAPQNPQAWSHE
jgi:hypothetical protein